VPINPRELAMLPAIIFNLWTVFQRGGRLQSNLWCSVNQEEMTPKTMFASGGKLVFVKQDCLPFDADVKSASVNLTTGVLSLELTILDLEKVVHQMSLDRKFARVARKGSTKAFVWGEEPFVTLRDQQWFRKSTFRSPRTLITSQPRLIEEGLIRFMEWIEMVYSFSCFQEEHRVKLGGDEQEGQSSTQHSAGPSMQMRQVLRQEQQQALAQQQQPLMIMGQHMAARLYHRQAILKMSGAQLRAHVAKELADNPILEEGRKSKD
jgi:hypothetical protein